MVTEKNVLEDILAQAQASYEIFLADGLDPVGEARRQVEVAIKEVSGQLKKVRPVEYRGKTELWSLCPFHDDRNVGSFSVDSSTGNHFCWVCGAQGGLVSLLKHFGLWTQKMRSAFKGIDLTALLKGTSDRGKVQSLTPLPEALLAHIKQYRPRRYVSKGHMRHILDNMEVCYDDQHQRICFPVRSATQDLVGIQSRVAFDTSQHLRWKWYRFELGDMQKYLLEPEFLDAYEPPRSTVFYNEHQVLIPLAQGAIDCVVIVEGMGGALRVMAAGYPVLATFGTRMGAGQKQRILNALRQSVISRHGHKVRVVLAHDGDAPGRQAALEVLFYLGMEADCVLAELPQGKDPEDLTPAALRHTLSSAQSLDKVTSDVWNDALCQYLATTTKHKKREAP